MPHAEQQESDDLRFWASRPFVGGAGQTSHPQLNRPADRSLRLLAWFAVLGSVVTCVAIVMPTLTSLGRDVSPGMVLLAAVTGAIAAGLFRVAGGVQRGRSWARGLGLVFGAVALVGFPLGTLIGGFLLWRLVFHWQPAAWPAP